MKRKTIIGVDAGSQICGIIIIDDGKIREGLNLANELVFDFLLHEFSQCNATVKHSFQLIIEDVRPYNMRISDGIIQTIKFLGELEYRLRTAGINFELVPRWKVKKWVFDTYNAISLQEVAKNIIRHNAREKKKYESKGLVFKEKTRSITFVYVDDRIVQKAMREHWEIIIQRGFGVRTMYNLKDHSWQALALVTFWLCSTVSGTISVP